MIEDSIGTLIKQIDDALRRDALRSLEKQNLTLTQVGLLTELESKDDSAATMKELEAALSVSQPTVVGIVKRLEQKGFVESFESRQDRRVKIVRLTDMGKELSQIGVRYIQESDSRMLTDFSAEERYMLRDMLERVLSTLKE